MMTMAGKKTGLESLLSKDYLAVSSSQTVGEAVALLREHKNDFRSKFIYLYVVDEGNKLVGVLRTRDLLMEDPVMPIGRLMKSSIVHVFEKAPLEEILNVFRTHSFFAIPVTDVLGHLVGVIPGERVQKYLSPTAGLNFYRFANFSREEVEGKSVREIVLKRTPWLLISCSYFICSYYPRTCWECRNPVGCHCESRLARRKTCYDEIISSFEQGNRNGHYHR